jgi:hypothetical protein
VIVSSSSTGTAIATSSAAAVDLIAEGTSGLFVCINASVVNTGSVAGLVSFDAGKTWEYLPAGFEMIRLRLTTITGIQLKRIGATDVTGVYASAWS